MMSQGSERATLPAASEDREAPRLVNGRYRLVRLLGEGTSKRVYLGHDELLDREVALSLVTDATLHGALEGRVLQEVRTTARLGDHPHVVTVHDFGVADGAPYFVFQLVRGGSVADRLRRRERAGMPVLEAVRIARQVADALAHAHEHGVVHRDVKPSNVLLAGEDTALLGDFGVALLAEPARPAGEGAIVGSAAYMAPEQAKGERVDDRTDLYALGATLFEMVCGRPPFEGDPVAVMRQHVDREPPEATELNPAVPAELAALIGRLLRKEPDLRPDSAIEVRRALSDIEAALSGSRSAREREAILAEWLPLPLQTEPERPFVGRRQALQRLRASWRRVGRHGPPRLALIAGEPGIGKTRLAAAFAQELQSEGVLVLYGRCDEDPLVSYQPFVEALRQLVARRPELVPELGRRLSPELVELGRLVPELRDRVPAGAAPAPEEATQRHLLFEAVAALLAGTATERPLLLVLDDLHWADKPTALLLRHLMRAPRCAVMVVGTFRDREIPDSHPLVAVLADLHRERRDDADRLERLTLEGLDERETGALILARDRRLGDPDIARLVHGETSGNPFFVEETLRDLRDADLPTAADAASALRRRDGVPSGAKVVIERRLSRLSPETVALLTRAAVCGREFRLDVLAEVLGAPTSEVTRGLEEAIAAGLVVEPTVDRFTFCHALVRETLYAGAGLKARVARLHLAVGEALEKVADERTAAIELAFHFHAARDVGGAEKAVRYALAAADRATDALAYEEAAAHKARAVEALERLGAERDAERCRVLRSLGWLQWQAGDAGPAQATFLQAAELARRLGDPEQFARAALGYGGRWYDAEHADSTMIALLEEALEVLPSGDSRTRAKVLARLADGLHVSDTEERAARLSRAAVDMARRLGDADALITALASRHFALLYIADLPERLAVGAEWLERAEAAGHRNAIASAQAWRVYDLLESGDAAAGKRAYDRLLVLADESRQPLFRLHAATWKAKWLTLAGRFGEAEETADECYRYGRRVNAPYADSLYGGQLLALRREQGRLTEVVSTIQRLLGWTPTFPLFRAGMMAVHLEAGELARAQAELSALVRDDCSAIPRDWFWLGTMCLLAEGCAALDDGDAAAALAGHLEPHAERNAQIGLGMFLGPVHRYLALLASQLGDHERARQHFDAALHRAAALGAPTIEAHAQCEYAELLLASGAPSERARARELLERAHDTARRLGMDPLMRRATRHLADVDGSARPA